MELLLQRTDLRENCTIGELSVDGEFECFTLEDTVRERPNCPVSEWKIAGKTAIPAGRYAVVVSVSPRFGKPLPLLVNVPGFVGVRVHCGNVAADTDGCLLVGERVAGDAIGESRKAFAALMEKISDAIESLHVIHIEIRNPE